VNENNVDLNRNFLSREEEYRGVSEGYRRQEALLNPRSLQSLVDAFYLRILWHIFRLGFPKWKESVACGQYEYPKGLFYGGKELEQGPALLLDWMKTALQGVGRVAAIDVHTGLGRWGQESRIVTYPPESEQFQFLERQLGSQFISLDPRQAAYHARGTLIQAIERELPWARTWIIGQEFGTIPPLRALKALRDENRAFYYGDPGQLDHPARRRLLDTFCPDDESWQHQVLQQGYQLALDTARLVFESSDGV
jgi:hypothetical protein